MAVGWPSERVEGSETVLEQDVFTKFHEAASERTKVYQHSSERPNVPYSNLKTSQRVLNTPRGRDVSLYADRLTVYNRAEGTLRESRCRTPTG